MSIADRLRSATFEDNGIEARTRLVLVRHGEARCNVEEVVGGKRGCTGLTDRGRRQIARLGERLSLTNELGEVAALYTSELARAYESAELLASYLPGLCPTRLESLCERVPGEADGLTWAEYEARYGGANYPGDRPDEPLSPGGETWIEFLDRAAGALMDLAQAHGGETILIVAHGGVIDASIVRYLSMPDDGTRVRLQPDHSSLTEWEHTGRRWRLVRYNDAAHLFHEDAADARPVQPDWVRIESGG